MIVEKKQDNLSLFTQFLLVEKLKLDAPMENSN